MATTESAWTPDREQLAANLRHLRRLLDRRTPRFEGVGELLRVAALLCPAATGIDALQGVVLFAVNHPQATVWVGTAPLLYGLTETSKGKLLSERRQLAFSASNENKLETWRTAREDEMANDLAKALVELVAANGTANLPSPPPSGGFATPAHLTLFAPVQVDGDSHRTLSGTVFDELRKVCENGMQKAVARNLIPTLTALAEIAVTGDGTRLQKVEELLIWAIHETESLDPRRRGLIYLFELDALRGQSMAYRRSLARPYLSDENDTRLKPYRDGEEEVRIFTAISPLLASLAIQEGLTDD